jgi:syntaxin-binding protein 5
MLLPTDPAPKLRLVAIRASGDTSVYTLFRAESGDWGVRPEPTRSETIPPLPSTHGGAFVLDRRLGTQLKADKTRLAAVIDAEHTSPELVRRDSGGREPRCVLVVVGTKGARCFADLNADKRTAKVDWGGKNGFAVCAQVVERNGPSWPS